MPQSTMSIHLEGAGLESETAFPTQTRSKNGKRALPALPKLITWQQLNLQESNSDSKVWRRTTH